MKEGEGEGEEEGIVTETTRGTRHMAVVTEEERLRYKWTHNNWLELHTMITG